MSSGSLTPAIRQGKCDSAFPLPSRPWRAGFTPLLLNSALDGSVPGKPPSTGPDREEIHSHPLPHQQQVLPPQRQCDLHEQKVWGNQ